MEKKKKINKIYSILQIPEVKIAFSYCRASITFELQEVFGTLCLLLLEEQLLRSFPYNRVLLRCNA